MLTIKQDSTRPAESGQYFVSLSDFAMQPNGDADFDMANMSRLGYWCDEDHLRYVAHAAIRVFNEEFAEFIVKRAGKTEPTTSSPPLTDSQREQLREILQSFHWHIQLSGTHDNRANLIARHDAMIKILDAKPEPPAPLKCVAKRTAELLGMLYSFSNSEFKSGKPSAAHLGEILKETRAILDSNPELVRPTVEQAATAKAFMLLGYIEHHFGWLPGNFPTGAKNLGPVIEEIRGLLRDFNS